MEYGVLYVATGNEYVEEAKRSAESLAEQMPDTPVALITDIENPGEIFDKVIHLEDPQYSGVDKPANLHRTPFDKTIYLDTDTYITETIDDIFDVLDQYHIATAITTGRHFDIGLPKSVPHRQSGVIAYRNDPEVLNVLKSWREEFEKTRSQGHWGEQPALTKILYYSNITVHTLPVEDNCICYYGERLEGPVRIVHGHAELDQIATKLNQTTRNRVFTSLFDSSILFVDEQSIPTPIKYVLSFKIDGIPKTAYRVVERLKNKL